MMFLLCGWLGAKCAKCSFKEVVSLFIQPHCGDNVLPVARQWYANKVVCSSCAINLRLARGIMWICGNEHIFVSEKSVIIS
jgi:hypothetical protein